MIQTDTATAPLLTIMVPTRNRIDTAVPTIKSLLRLPDQDLEIFVQDCSDTEALGHYIDGNISDPRLRYHYSAPPLSMVENWNLGMPHLRGEYLCIIGDDDGISSRLMDAVRWAKCERLDAITASNCAEYLWPDYPVNGQASKLNVDGFTGAVVFPEITQEINQAAYGYGQLVMRLPRVYQSVMKRELFSKLHDLTGVYFDGMAPDFYIPYALTGIIGRYCVVDFPLLISGRSRKSNSGRSRDPQFARRHCIQLHVAEFKDNVWPDILPSTCNIYSILAESMIAGFKNTGQDALINNMNLALLFASSFVYEAPHSFYVLNEFRRAIRKLRRNPVREWSLFCAYTLARLLMLPVLPLKKRLRLLSGRDKTTPDVSDIGEAMRALDDILLQANKSFPPGLRELTPDKQIR